MCNSIIRYVVLVMLVAIALLHFTGNMVYARANSFSDCSICNRATGGFSDAFIRLNSPDPTSLLHDQGIMDIVTVTGTVTVVSSEPVPGDVDGNGEFEAPDITLVERIIAGLDPSTPGADANQDGVLNAQDITMVERKIARLE